MGAEFIKILSYVGTVLIIPDLFACLCLQPVIFLSELVSCFLIFLACASSQAAVAGDLGF